MANYDFSHQPSYPQPGVPEPGPKAEATPPSFVDIPNIFNFRHLGAHALPSGRETRTDLIYRSAEPSRVTPDGVNALQQLGISTVFDLRSVSEIERNKAQTPVTDIPGTTRVAIPVFTHASPDQHARRMGYYGEEGNRGFVKAYLDILESGKGAYRTVFEHIRDKPSEPLLVHCTAGKDRTGVLIALALGVVGVADTEIAEEYALTEIGLKQWKATIIEHILMDPAMEGDRARVERMVSATEENMMAFLEDLRSVWGGPQGYLEKGLGFSSHDVEVIKTNITKNK